MGLKRGSGWNRRGKYQENTQNRLEIQFYNSAKYGKKDGILMVVIAKVLGKQLKPLIDNGTTRRFVTPDHRGAEGLNTLFHDILLEKDNETKAYPDYWRDTHRL